MTGAVNNQYIAHNIERWRWMLYAAILTWVNLTCTLYLYIESGRQIWQFKQHIPKNLILMLIPNSQRLAVAPLPLCLLLFQGFVESFPQSGFVLMGKRRLKNFAVIGLQLFHNLVRSGLFRQNEKR